MYNSTEINSNKSAFEFSSQAIKQVVDLCSPINSIGIRCFRYMRLYKDCTYIVLTNGFEDFLEDSMSTLKDLGKFWGSHIKYVKNGFDPFLMQWPHDAFKKDINMNLFHKYDFWNGVSLIYRYDNYIDIVSFALGASHKDNCGLLVNNKEFLKTFINHFREKSSNLLESKEKSKLALFGNRFDTAYSPNPLLEKVKIVEKQLKRSMVRSFEDLKLSPRELECLELMSHGKTAKEIAQEIQISPRTVESYVTNIKVKTECNYKSELIDFFFKNQYKIKRKYS